MNPNSQSARDKKTIPIFLYETNQVAKKFEQLDFQLAQSEDERIAVDNVAKAIDPTAKVSSVSTNLVSTLNAIKILRRKILFLIDIFENSKEVQENPEYKRRLNQIFNQIQVLDLSFQADKNKQSTDPSQVSSLEENLQNILVLIFKVSMFVIIFKRIFTNLSQLSFLRTSWQLNQLFVLW